MDWPTETRATFNICSDRLKVWFAQKLPPEEYQQAKRIGFVWWPGSKCLTCTWRPDAQDFITSRGIEIEEDDQPDDAEARVQRFSGYAADAEQSAASAIDYKDSGRANTARRQRNAQNRAENETDRAAHWNRRIEAAIRHASFKERPDVIARRIEGLETDLRKHVAAITPHTDEKGEIIRYKGQIIVGSKGRGAHAIEESELEARKSYHGRWISHIEDRLLYERAALAAAGGLQADLAVPGGEKIFEVGGAVKAPRWSQDHWLEIVKLNRATVEIYDPSCAWCKFRKLDPTEITEVASKLRVDSGEIPLTERAPKIEKAKIEKVATRDGTRPEKFGAWGEVPGSFRTGTPGDEDFRWFLITRVNAKTVEYIIKRVEQIKDASGAVKPRVSFLITKEDIGRIKHLLTAAQVKETQPQLLAELEELRAMEARIAARKAEREAAAQSQAAPQTEASNANTQPAQEVAAA